VPTSKGEGKERNRKREGRGKGGKEGEGREGRGRRLTPRTIFRPWVPLSDGLDTPFVKS